MSLMPYFTTATELQRNYKKVVRKAKKLKRPIAVLSNNKPELVIVDYDTFGIESFNPNRPAREARKTGVDAIFGTWTKKEADEFNRTIEEEFERIDPEDWK